VAETLLSGWWKRLRGRLEPEPCPYSVAGVLETPLRRFVASPERVLGAFGLSTGQTALEIGPGIGYYSLEAARRLGQNGRLICLDIQRDMALELQRRLDSASLAADCLEASALDLPLNSGSIDHVLLIGVLGEFPDRTTALKEMHRVLRPGGRLSVSEQMPDPDFMFKGTLRRELKAAGFDEERTSGWLWYTSNWKAAA